MRDPNAYPELILDAAQDEIRALARKQARDEARRAAKAAGRRSRGGALVVVAGARQRSAEPAADGRPV